METFVTVTPGSSASADVTAWTQCAQLIPAMETLSLVIRER